MNEAQKPTVELIDIPELVSMPNKFSTGPVMGRFLAALRDDKKILANQCAKCGRAQLPPRIVCAECNIEVPDANWIEVGPGGYITIFDVTFIPTLNPLTGKMREVPYTTCSVVLDGGDAALMHFLDETDPKKIKMFNRVEAVFRPDGERTGTVLDILYFKVIPGKVQEVSHGMGF